MLWLDELSEDAVLGAMKAGRGYVTESPNGPHLSIGAASKAMGDTIPGGPIEAVAEIRGASGDELVWLDASGIVACQAIADDAWIGGYSGAPEKFLRAEIHAKASRDRLLAEFDAAAAGKEIARSIDAAEIAKQPILRALSNPIYVGA